MQKLSGSHKALVEMQDDVSELLRSATREYKQTQVCMYPVLCDDRLSGGGLSLC